MSAPPGEPEVPPHIVDAARHVLASDGLKAATLERISAAAGISRMTLHRRGLSKGDIMRALAARLQTDYRDALWPALVSRGTGRERLTLALQLLCEVTERNRATLEALPGSAREEIYHDDGPDRLTRKEFTEPLQRLLIDGAADRTLRSGETEETATLVFNAVAHTYRHLRTGHRWDPDRARDGVIRLIMDGLARG